jgi:hypothetical protein
MVSDPPPTPPASPVRPDSPDQSLHDHSFNITIEVAEPVVERYVTISSIIIYFKNVKKNENIFMIRHHH